MTGGQRIRKGNEGSCGDLICGAVLAVVWRD